MRPDGDCSAFGVGGLHTKKHEPRTPDRTRFGAGRDANAFVEDLRVEPETLALDRLDVMKAPDEHHIVSAARQLETVVAANYARTHRIGRPAPGVLSISLSMALGARSQCDTASPQALLVGDQRSAAWAKWKSAGPRFEPWCAR